MEASSATTAPEQNQNPTASTDNKQNNKGKKNFNKKNNNAKPGAEGEENAGKGHQKNNKDKSGNVNANVAAAAKKAAASNPNEPYVFIIKNAENDLCRIHESALPQFLGLNVKNQEKRKDGASYYEVKIRSETRTGEITFHGKDESAFFKTSVPHAAKEKVNINKKAGEKREREEAEEEAKEDPATQGEATVAATEGEARYSTVNDMLDNTRARPYYNAHLTFKHSVGEEAAASLMTKLTGAVAEVNKKMNPKALRKVLKDVPGFLSCWFLKATGPTTTQFRVVFNSEAELLSAKEMLDQFEADEGVRVAIKLTDSLATKFQKFLVEKSSAGADSGDVVALSTHNADYE